MWLSVCRIKLFERVKSLNLQRRCLAQQASSEKSKETPIEHCHKLVRRYDWEGYMCTLLFPKQARASAFALRGFNTELAMANEKTTDVVIGQMRLQFWKDTLEKIYAEKPPRTPVALALAYAVHKHGLPKLWLQRLITKREQYLAGKVCQSLDELDKFSDDTVGVILLLLLQILEIKDIDADRVAKHAGRAIGLLNFIRAMPYHASQGSVLLPPSMLEKHSVTKNDLFLGKNSKEVRDLTFDLAGAATANLDIVKALEPKLPKGSSVVFLSVTTAQCYFDRLHNVGYRPFHGSLQQRDQLLPARLFIKKYRNTF